MTNTVLQLNGVRGGYGGHTVLRGVDLTLTTGQIMVVRGPNAAGKSTLVQTIAGHVPATGSVYLRNRDVTTWPAHRRAKAGLGLVPQGRRLFESLSVAEHLAVAGASPDRAQAILEALPRLKQRLHHRPRQLSGGEQQMLAIGRALILKPAVLLLDEPTEGLAPAVVSQLTALLDALAAAGTAILLTDHSTQWRFTAPTIVRRLTRGILTEISDHSPLDLK
jgi:branched-chain amino acid transport system ATP-binding protein